MLLICFIAEIKLKKFTKGGVGGFFLKEKEGVSTKREMILKGEAGKNVRTIKLWSVYL